jgi:hypothetical protein
MSKELLIADAGTKPLTVVLRHKDVKLESAHGFLFCGKVDKCEVLEPYGMKVEMFWRFLPTAVFKTSALLVKEINRSMEEGFGLVAVFHHDGPTEYKLMVNGPSELEEAEAMVLGFYKSCASQFSEKLPTTIAEGFDGSGVEGKSREEINAAVVGATNKLAEKVAAQDPEKLAEAIHDVYEELNDELLAIGGGWSDLAQLHFDVLTMLVSHTGLPEYRFLHPDGSVNVLTPDGFYTTYETRHDGSRFVHVRTPDGKTSTHQEVSPALVN